MNGIIHKGIGGFYYVQCGNELIECKPRGLFRKQGIKPVAGDAVELATEAGTYYIETVLPRKNVFIRPPVANVDQFFIVVSTVEPVPSFYVIDKLTAVALEQDVNPIVLITKLDMSSAQPIIEAYANSGIQVLQVSAADEESMGQIRQMLAGKLSVFTGNSGVGKSTLLNALLPEAQREVGEISQKLGRGRHTTREVELIEVADGLLADTPGFASFDLQRVAPIEAENLQFVFPEVKRYISECRYTGCSHTVEAGCAVRAALESGAISKSRYQSYVALYEEAKAANKY